MIPQLPPFTDESDFEDVLDQELTPHIDKIMDICISKGIPILLIVQWRPDSHFRNICVPAGASDAMYELARFCAPEQYAAAERDVPKA